MLRILNVAEKNSVAKDVSDKLSNGSFQRMFTDSKFNPVYQFPCNFRNQQTNFTFTSVTGHLMGMSFPDQYTNWQGTNPMRLLDEANVECKVDPEKINLKKNLERLAKANQVLFLWLDCDREGEAIAFEVIEVCVKSNPQLEVIRAQFSSTTLQEVQRAIQNPRPPNRHLSDAVLARTEIDLRIGAAFTRFQTLTLRPRFSSILNSNNNQNQGLSKVISYGPCQFPTMGFVVERYRQVQAFVPEDFWHVEVDYKDNKFGWARGRLYCEASAYLFYYKCLNHLAYDGTAQVVSNQGRPTIKSRPFPMNTIKLQKLATSKLRISGHQVMEIAEKLYNKGFISYPRTETDKFPPSMDLKALVGLQESHTVWGQYAHDLLHNDKYQSPKNGKDSDEAHPPIHPVAKLESNTNGLLPREWQIYEMVTRHFLACCSRDAKGEETSVEISIAGEKFRVKGLQIKERNYLEVYTYEKWADKELPDNLQTNSTFVPDDISLEKGSTTAPNLLREQDLIVLMDSNGIGTDATIAEHIKTVQDRNYVVKEGIYMKPTNLAIALVESYEAIGLKLAQPDLRARMERMMRQVAQGHLTKDQMLTNCMQEMIQIFTQVQNSTATFIHHVERFYVQDGNGDSMSMQVANGPVQSVVDTGILGQCPYCQDVMLLITYENTTRILQCRSGFQNSNQNELQQQQNNNCITKMRLPKTGNITTTGFQCPLCNYVTLSLKNTTTLKQYELCPHCYMTPQVQLEEPDQIQQPQQLQPPVDIEDAHMQVGAYQQCTPCFKCRHPTCSRAGGQQITPIFNCRLCNTRSMTVKKMKTGRFLIGCLQYPKCKNTIFLPDIITQIDVPPVESQRLCEQRGCGGMASALLPLVFKQGHNINNMIMFKLLEEQDNTFCLVPGCYDGWLESEFTYYEAHVAPTNHANFLQNANVNSRSNQDLSNITCFKCKQTGHFATKCPALIQPHPQQPQYSNANVGNNSRGNGDNRCFKCQQPGHYANNCPQQNGNQQNHKPNNFQYNENNRNAQNVQKPKSKNAVKKNVKKTKKNYKQNTNDNANNEFLQTVTCFVCKQKGHYANNCPSRNQQQDQQPNVNNKKKRSIQKKQFQNNTDFDQNN